MHECTRCGGYKPSRDFYSIGPARRMSECKDCNRRRHSEAYTPRPRMNLNLGRDARGRFRSAA